MSTEEHLSQQEGGEEPVATGQDGRDATAAEDGARADVEPGSSNEGIETLRAELETARDQVLRAQAEMQNLRRRVDRDIENAHKFALEKFVAELLPVVDNIERAVHSIDKNDESQAAVGEGVELTLKRFLDVLARNKVTQVDPLNESFDPEFHQAMSMDYHPEAPANTVTEVFQKGFLLNDRLVRPAMVVVSKGPKNESET